MKLPPQSNRSSILVVSCSSATYNCFLFVNRHEIGELTIQLEDKQQFNKTLKDSLKEVKGMFSFELSYLYIYIYIYMPTFVHLCRSYPFLGSITMTSLYVCHSVIYLPDTFETGFLS